jgi:alcohol dehydrogenase class IV
VREAPVAATILIPSTLIVGGGAVNEAGPLAQRLGMTRPLLVADPGLAKLGLLDSVMAALERSYGAAPALFDAIVPDPTSVEVEALAAALVGGGHDGVVAIGGGSAMDTAKAAGVIAVQGGKACDYKVPRVVDGARLPLICIPTTAGTGSEVTRVTVITDAESQEKMLCGGPAYLPSGAIIDYELSLSCPLRLTADTAIDSLTHALEAYVSRKANPVSDGFAILAMTAIWHNIRRVCADLSDRAGREALMLAATQGGLAFSNASVALVHGMSRPIGALFHVPHGLSNAMLLPAVTRFSASAALPRYADCARRLGLADDGTPDALATERLIAGLEALNADLGVPSPCAYGLNADAYHQAIPLMAEQALASGSPGNNPRVPSAAEIAYLYHEVWQ